MVKIVGVVIGVFVICWGLFFVLNFVYVLCKSCLLIFEEVVLVVKWLYYVNSVLNLIIYVCMNKDFCLVFKKIFVFFCFYIVLGIWR